MNSGYILLWRKFREWEYYTDINVRVIYQDLILSANWQDKKFNGIVIKKGQRLTSYQKLSEINSLSVQQVRTALKKLIKSGYISQKTFSKYQIITVLDYAKYQDFSKIKKNNQKSNKQKTEYIHDINAINELENAQDNKQITNKQQTSNNKQYINNTLSTLKPKASASKCNFKKEDILNYLHYKTELITNFNRETKEKYKKLIAECPGSKLFEKVKPLKSYEYMNEYDTNMFVKEVYKKGGYN